MKITITKHQLDLLEKRNAASERALSESRTAEIVAKQSAISATNLRQAFEDVIGFITVTDTTVKIEENQAYSKIEFGTDKDGNHFLEMTEVANPKPIHKING